MHETSTVPQDILRRYPKVDNPNIYNCMNICEPEPNFLLPTYVFEILFNPPEGETSFHADVIIGRKREIKGRLSSEKPTGYIPTYNVLSIPCTFSADGRVTTLEPTHNIRLWIYPSFELGDSFYAGVVTYVPQKDAFESIKSKDLVILEMNEGSSRVLSDKSIIENGGAAMHEEHVRRIRSQFAQLPETFKYFDFLKSMFEYQGGAGLVEKALMSLAPIS